MNCPLAVFLNQPGKISETFIQRHVLDLLPGRTAVVTARPHPNPVWGPDGPVLYADCRQDSILYRWLTRAGLPVSPAADRAAAFLRQHGVEVALGQYLDFAYPWFRFLAGTVRFFVHAHGYDVSIRLREPVWRRRYRAYARAAGVITVSESSRRELIGLGLPAAKVHVVPCGTDVPAACPAAAPVGSGPVRCLAVGRMVAKKGPDLLVRAFAHAVRLAGGADIRLDYVGEGLLLDGVRRLAGELGVADRVVFHGALPPGDVRDLMRRAHLFAQHSRVDPQTGDSEGLPVAILEAMAAGLPVVATRHAGIPEAVQAGETGYLVAEGDWLGMGEWLARLARDETARRELGAAGWARAAERFTWSVEREHLRRLMGLPGDG